VTVNDSNTTISYIVTNVTADHVDTCNDIIYGTADPGSKVTVEETRAGIKRKAIFRKMNLEQILEDVTESQ